jgi:hypothetical protein
VSHKQQPALLAKQKTTQMRVQRSPLLLVLLLLLEATLLVSASEGGSYFLRHLEPVTAFSLSSSSAEDKKSSLLGETVSIE